MLVDPQNSMTYSVKASGTILPLHET